MIETCDQDKNKKESLDPRPNFYRPLSPHWFYMLRRHSHAPFKMSKQSSKKHFATRLILTLRYKCKEKMNLTKKSPNNCLSGEKALYKREVLANRAGACITAIRTNVKDSFLLFVLGDQRWSERLHCCDTAIKFIFLDRFIRQKFVEVIFKRKE